MQTAEIIKQLTVEGTEKNVKETRLIVKHSIGKVIRQGDIYIHMVNAGHPVGKQINEKQLVDGTSLGARHVLQGDAVIYETAYRPSWLNTKMFLGKAFDVKGRAVITHPEHAHVEFGAGFAGRCVVSHQIDIRTLQKVSD